MPMTASAIDIPTATQRTAEGYWLFSSPVDLGVFLGSAGLSFLALIVGWQLGWLEEGITDWAWVPAVLLVDVAHVYATGFRVYFDPVELRRRPWLYTLTPILSFLIGVALYTEGEPIFWRVLAYLAVFHFVRQQYGWVALYRARLGEKDTAGYWIDTLAIYSATIYPLIYWHAHLPRKYWWFLAGDFIGIPTVFATALAPVYWTILILYAGRSAWRYLARGELNPGKDIVVATTAACWYVGIIAIDSDYAFTVTNVFIHGLPYLALVYWYRAQRQQWHRPAYWPRIAFFLGTLWMLAYAEELLWDRSVWQERSWLFGPAWELESAQFLLIPLLAVPQWTHYILDGFIWRRSSSDLLGRLVHPDDADHPATVPISSS